VRAARGAAGALPWPPIVPPPPDTVLRWSEHGLAVASGEPAGPLLAADSWLVSGGAVRGYDAHWARFGGWCRELGVPPDQLACFRLAVTASLPRGGRWFPRVEVAAAGAEHDLRLRLRPAPPASVHARVLVAGPGDPRTRPTWKGPDLERLLALRERAAAAGADELLLCDGDGRLLEGALSSLLWWQDETLCTTPAQRTLAGITRALLLEIAGRRGVAVAVRSPLPDELAGCETWLTSALHGIRVVADWGPAPRAAAWRAELDRTVQRLDAAR
jgi:branched-subunit amino acid aminotransferase/4-amino-4-deoxychorismate lyase